MLDKLFGAELNLVALSFVSYIIFHRYEPEKSITVFSLLLLVPAAFSRLDSQVYAPIAFLAYWSLLLLFTAAYRLSPFHPLAKFPGPLINKLTKIKMLQVAFGGRLFEYHAELFQKYGDIVRIGPNELSYNNVEGIKSVLADIPKGPFFSYGTSLINVTDPTKYPERRQVWNKAFSTASLKNFEDTLVTRMRELVDGLDERKSAPIDISKWMEFLAFDIMGDFVFSYPFDLMKHGGDAKDYRKTVIESIAPVMCMCQTPWFVKLLLEFVDPGAPLRNLARKMVTDRLKGGSNVRDLYYYLGRENSTKRKQTDEELNDDGFVAIIAGSDTTSSTLANLWTYIMMDPQIYARLQNEVDTVFPAGEEPIDQQKLSAMPYLNACLNETMRIIHPVPSGSQRHVPAGGKMLGQHFVPEGNNVILIPFALQRDPRNFSPAPDTFWPDRWLAPEERRSIGDTTKPLSPHVNVALNTAAFIPFSSAPRSCPGKNLAMMEMRMAIAFIMQRFDMRAAEGVDLKKWEGSLEDYFILKKGELNVVLTERV